MLFVFASGLGVGSQVLGVGVACRVLDADLSWHGGFDDVCACGDVHVERAVLRLTIEHMHALALITTSLYMQHAAVCRYGASSRPAVSTAVHFERPFVSCCCDLIRCSTRRVSLLRYSHLQLRPAHQGLAATPCAPGTCILLELTARKITVPVFAFLPCTADEYTVTDRKGALGLFALTRVSKVLSAVPKYATLQHPAYSPFYFVKSVHSKHRLCPRC